MKVAIYQRVSTRTQEVINQEQVLVEYVNKMGYLLYKVYSDTESGGNLNRPAFKKLFSDAAQRKFDIVLFWSLDRFCRSGVLDSINLLNQLEQHKVSYRSYAEPYIDSSGVFKEVIISILAVLAKQERIRIGERVRLGLDRARSQGRIGGRPRVSEDKINRIRELRTQGISLRKIAAEVDVHFMTVKQYIL
jgi:DNA invertase Pin-like site-specific DNA recombinase